VIVPQHPHPCAVPDAPLACLVCARPLVGCSAGLYCVGCGLPHVERRRYGYLDLAPSVYYLPVA
jgi:hypothetical protein